MYTVCPKCTLALAVSAADLRAGQGYVRCGRCTNVFNALLNLRDETDTTPGLPLDEAVTAAFTPEPTPLPGEDRRARQRLVTTARPQPELDLDLSPPAMPVPEAGPEPVSAFAAQVPVSEAPVAALDLIVPDASTDEAALDLVVESASADEPDLDLVFDPADEPTMADHGTPAHDAPEHEAPLRLPEPVPPVPMTADRAPFEERAIESQVPQAHRNVLPPQGLTPLSAEPPRTPLPAKGLTPLHTGPSGDGNDDGEGLESDEFRGTGTYETIVLQGDSILQTEELLPEQDIDDRIAAVAHQLAFDARGGMQAGAEDERAEALAAEIAAAVAGLGPTMAPPRPRWMVAAAVLLALLLGVQVVHHWRNRLATLPAFNGPLTRLYASLGLPLAPEWDLAAYDLRLLGASADPEDTRVIHVRLSLASHATVAQALPLVRLRLIDRYGKALGAGELQPVQYLPRSLPPQALLQPDQRIDSDVRVLDPTQQASSFELDVCLPRPGGGLRCAGDLAFAGGHS
ncbi:MAG: hypothetical protein RL684_2571 [Pseudomonadota bacterium]